MEEEMNVVSRDLSCTFCDRVFSRRFALKRHLKICNHNQENLKEGVILKEFNTFDEFITWKEEEEKMTMSKYVKHRGIMTVKNGYKIVSYRCCRSGTYRPKGKGVRSLKRQGSAKIGTSCPAVMKVKQRNENVVVHYFPKHENHEIQLEHLRLSQSDRTAIDGRLKGGASKNKICKNINKRIHEDAQFLLNEAVDTENNENDYNQNTSKEEDFQVFPSSSKSTEGQRSVQNKLDNISALIKECHFTDEEINKIHKNLNAILNICYTNKKNSKSIKTREPSSTVNINKKIEKQSQYFSTRKKRYSGSILNNPIVITLNTDFDHKYFRSNK